MDRESAIKQLVGIRAAVGAAAWIAPTLFGKPFGLRTEDNPQSPYVARLFGARDVALAYGAKSTSGAEQDRWLTAALGCDIADAAAGIAGWRGGYLSPLTCLLVTAPALHGVSLGLAALRGGSAPAPASAPA